MKNTQNSTIRKRLEHFSYCPYNNIGKGYSSYVYKGRNDHTDETVAIKVIDMKMLKGQVHRNLLSSELQALKALKSCNHIIDLHHIYSTKNATYIITQFCQGGDLSRIISGKRGMPESDAVDLLKQIVDGYSNIFSQNIIHRDLKPANILLKDNKVKIADFGFAMKSADSKKFSSYNVGSPIYMPPQALNDNRYTFKSDVWAIGVIFFQLLTGKAPWRAKTQKQLGRQLTSVPISRLIPKNISIASSQFLQRVLCADYQKRMNPQELIRYMNMFKEQNLNNKKLIISQRTESMNHRPFSKSNSVYGHQDSSLNKNTIYQPKNMRALTFLKGNNNSEQNKNIMLLKTASTAHNNTQTTFNVNIDKKQISKQLLSQIHFCRFIYKLLKRMEHKLQNRISKELKQSMQGMIYQKLNEVDNLTKLNPDKAKQYKKTQQCQKVRQIVKQYITKYNNQLNQINSQHNCFKLFQECIKIQLGSLYQQVRVNQIDDVKDHVIILDYLITLKQLVHLIQKYDIQSFHAKSKIQAIVEGTPSKNITQEHIQGITTKLRAIKII